MNGVEMCIRDRPNRKRIEKKPKNALPTRKPRGKKCMPSKIVYMRCVKNGQMKCGKFKNLTKDVYKRQLLIHVPGRCT